MTVADQAALAKWCKKNRLPDEERVHWLAVLQLEPSNSEAIKGLDLHPYRGMLLTNAADFGAKGGGRCRAEGRRARRPFVARWAAAMEKQDASGATAITKEVRKVSRSSEVLALERFIWLQLGSKSDKKRTNRR